MSIYHNEPPLLREELPCGSVLEIVGGKPRVYHKDGVVSYFSLDIKNYYDRSGEKGFVKRLQRPDKEVIRICRIWAKETVRLYQS